ncbi:MAG: hypothetical protein ACJAQ3_000651, partial [Planctomycetota bacterium]
MACGTAPRKSPAAGARGGGAPGPPGGAGTP